MSFWEDIKRPFNQLSLFLGITGVGLAIYFYYFPHTERKIALVFEPPSLIFDSRLSTPTVRLVDAANNPIKFDTYLQTFTIWNNGSVPIEPTDVRRPITLMFPGANQILDYKIISDNDPEISGFNLSLAADSSKALNNIVLRWKHFDPKRAVKIQVIFSQSQKPKPVIEVGIVGIDKFTNGQKQRDWGQYIALLGFGYVGLVGFSIIKKNVKVQNPLKWIPVGIGVVAVIVALIVFWAVLTLNLSPTPPI